VDSHDYVRSKKWRGEFQEMAKAIIAGIDKGLGAAGAQPRPPAHARRRAELARGQPGAFPLPAAQRRLFPPWRDVHAQRLRMADQGGRKL